MRVTWNDPWELQRVNEHGFGSAPQHLRGQREDDQASELTELWSDNNSDTAADLDDGVCTRLSSGSCSDAEDGVGDGHAVFSTDGVKQSHADAEEGHADGSTASPTPQTPQQADSVHRRPGNLQREDAANQN